MTTNSLPAALANALENELKNKKCCGLKCAPLGSRPPAVNQIIQPLPDGGTRTWAICRECEQALLGPEWLLLLCLGCGSSQWVCRALAPWATGPTRILSCCPECSKKNEEYADD